MSSSCSRPRIAKEGKGMKRIKGIIIGSILLAVLVCSGEAHARIVRPGSNTAVWFLYPVNGQSISGSITIILDIPTTPSESNPDTVWWTRLSVDGTPIDSASGYNELSWNSATVANGTHELTVDAYSYGSTTPLGSTTIEVTVNNSGSVLSSTPTPTPEATSSAPSSEQTPIRPNDPTAAPTAATTSAPTSAPTAAPTSAPTAAPTAIATPAPTAAPTANPTTAPTAQPTATTGTGLPGGFSISVSANHLVNGSGQPVFLHGANRDDAAYGCVSANPVIFEGPVDQAAVSAMTAWNINAVRLTLNEDCWLGINGINSAYSGANYQSAIVNFVNLLESNGIYVELGLIWNAPGSYVSNSLEPEADSDHAPAFWQSVASTFANDRGTIFDLFNEPYASYNGSGSPAANMSWGCWANGGCTVSCDQTDNGGSCPNGTTYTVAGMQTLINTIRAQEGSWHHPLLLPGLGSSNDLSGWLANMPSDSANALIAGYHWYNDNAGGCVMPLTNSCWSNLQTIGQQVPLVGDEFGNYGCSWTSNMNSFVSFMEGNANGFEAWVWNGGSACPEPSLVSDWNGTATSYGQNYENLLLSLP
jgi:endoglucanase